MNGFPDNPLLQIGMGMLGGNYGPNSRAAFANAMKGGLLGMQQAGVNQARQAQTQMAQQQLMMAQAAAKKKQEEREQFEAWVSTLPPQEQAMARGNPQLYMEQRKLQLKQQYPGQTGFGTTVQYVYDRNLKQVLPAQASQSGGVFIIMPDGSKQPFDPAKHELRKPFTMQNFGGYQAPFQPLSGQVGVGAGGGAQGPMPTPNVSPVLPPLPGGQTYLEPGEVLSPSSQYRPPGLPPGAIANTLKPGERPEVQAQQTAAKKEAEIKAASQAQAQVDLPGIEIDMETTKGYIDELRNHPGLESGTGFSSLMPVIPGTDRAAFEARRQQIQAGAFLTGFQQLKGGGPITEVEGLKAERAVARMEAATSKEAFLVALKDYENAMEAGLRKLKKRAGMSGAESPTARPAGKVIDFNDL